MVDDIPRCGNEPKPFPHVINTRLILGNSAIAGIVVVGVQTPAGLAR